MRDPYEVLGLAKTASAGEIKSAYRRLAKKFHPDQSKEPRAKDRFAEINSAYEIVGDEKKRGEYDRGEIDAEGKPRHPGFEDFARAGGRARQGAGPDFSHFSFDFGDGRPGGATGVDPDILSELFGVRGGAGRSRGPLRGEDVAAVATVPLALAAAGGSARVILPTGKTLDVAIPVGVEDGKQIRLRGQGQAGVRGGPAGDALVT
ncbi:MAG TPA: DnaJ domain-containing protein, partial [Roseiarcus sp.]|nr:DnaJ domain-containing protein [Roseiarcus sp.]